MRKKCFILPELNFKKTLKEQECIPVGYVPLTLARGVEVLEGGGVLCILTLARVGGRCCPGGVVTFDPSLSGGRSYGWGGRSCDL